MTYRERAYERIFFGGIMYTRVRWVLLNEFGKTVSLVNWLFQWGLVVFPARKILAVKMAVDLAVKMA